MMVGKSINSSCVIDGKTFVGKLFFYDAGYKFKAESANGRIDYGLVLYSDIEKVSFKNTFGFIPNGLIVMMKNGVKYEYISMNRKAIKNFLDSRIQL